MLKEAILNHVIYIGQEIEISEENQSDETKKQFQNLVQLYKVMPWNDYFSVLLDLVIENSQLLIILNIE